MYWVSSIGRECARCGDHGDDEAEFEYLYGGQETYAPRGNARTG